MTDRQWLIVSEEFLAFPIYKMTSFMYIEPVILELLRMFYFSNICDNSDSSLEDFSLNKLPL